MSTKKSPVKAAKTNPSVAESKKITENQTKNSGFANHGKDRHLIPDHGKEMPKMKDNSKKEEKIFHDKEEVALQEENRKVKTGRVAKITIKRLFNSQGRR